jgi:predicted dehydrogenase
MLHGAIIGLGKIAQTGHLPAYADSHLSSKVKIVAAVETEKKCVKNAQKILPNLPIYETIEDLLRNEKIDFFDICTPPAFHFEAVKSGADHGLHILCEKPLATSVTDAQLASEFLKKRKGLIFMPCHQYRYSPIWRQFKEFIEANAEPDRYLLQFNVFRTQADMGYFAPNPSWRTVSSVSGGGILADTGLHYIYLSLWMLGVPQNLMARVHNLRYHNIDVEDTAIVFIEFEKGVAEINLTWGGDRRANNARLVCHNGSLVYEGQLIEKYTNNVKETISVPDASDKSHYGFLYVSLIDEFIKNIEEGRESTGWIDEACHSLEILRACYHSSQTQKSVSIDSTTWGKKQS